MKTKILRVVAVLLLLTAPQGVFAESDREKEFMRMVIEHMPKDPERRLTQQMIDNLPKTPEEFLTRLQNLWQNQDIGGVDLAEKLTGIGREKCKKEYSIGRHKEKLLHYSFVVYKFPITLSLSFDNESETDSFKMEVYIDFSEIPQTDSRMTPKMTQEILGTPSEFSSGSVHCDDGDCGFMYRVYYIYRIGNNELEIKFIKPDIKGAKGRRLRFRDDFELYKDFIGHRVNFMRKKTK